MIKDVSKMIFKNSKQVIKFEFFFKIITLFIALPLFLNVFKLIMKLTGYNYLTFENIMSFFCKPLTIFAIFIFLVIMALYSIFDIGTIIILLDASFQGKKIELKNAVGLSLKKSLRIFLPRNLGLLVFVLFLIPFLNLGIGSGVITSLKMPEFIMDFISSNPILNVFYFIIILLLIALLLRWLYSFHYYFLEDKDFKEACKCSASLSNKKHIKDILAFGFMEFFIVVFYMLFIILGILLIVLFNKAFREILLLRSALISLILFFIFISLVIFSILNRAVLYAVISAFFYHHKNTLGEEISHIDVKKNINKKITKKRWNIIKVCFVLLGFSSLTLFTHNVLNGKFSLDMEFVKKIDVTAHRGASVDYPENTMAAFVGAKKLGADWIELDVAQTKDEVLIITHDKNFKRVSGVDLNTYDATYDEILKLDVGSYKGNKFKNERVPLLEDVIIWAKDNNMKLNIELKPRGYEKDFEEKVIKLIKKYNYIDNCVVSSNVYSTIVKVKEIDSSIPTVYVTSLAFGDVTDLKAADIFSIESSSITGDLVNKIHKDGKQIYAWTLNTEESINEMISLDVDNIITDNITLGKDLVAKSKSSNLVIELVKLIDGIFS